jgi:hypothetical protein
MKRMKINKLIVLIILLIPLMGFAQQIEHRLEKPPKLYVGTPFHVFIDITTDKADSIFAPEIDTLDIFILKNIRSEDEIEEDKKKTSLDLIFQPFDTGEFTFPPLEFAVKTLDSLVVLHTSEFQLNIETVLTDSSQTVRDIADPLKVNLGFWDYFIPLVAIILLVFIIRMLIKLLRRKSVEDISTRIIDERSPYLIALELLQNLKKEKLLQKGDFLNLHFRLSFILRLFIELNYHINAVEMTTSEIRRNFILHDHKEKNQVLEFLIFADKIKFAKFIPELKDSEKELKWLEKYLKSFEPEEEQDA